MSHTDTGNIGNPIFAAIGTQRRRDTLRILLDRDSVICEDELARVLAMTELGQSLVDETTKATKEIHINLRYIQLPLLEDVGLITWTREEATVAIRDHPAVNDPRFQRLLGTEVEDIDDVFSAFAHEYRRLVLTILKDTMPSLSRTVLAREILRRTTDQTEPDPEAVNDVTISLHHVHLPKLADDDLIRYNPETGAVRYPTHPAVEEVFQIIHTPDEQFADKLGGFLDELEAATNGAYDSTDKQLDWPHFWSDPHYE